MKKSISHILCASLVSLLLCQNLFAEAAANTTSYKKVCTTDGKCVCSYGSNCTGNDCSNCGWTTIKCPTGGSKLNQSASLEDSAEFSITGAVSNGDVPYSSIMKVAGAHCNSSTILCNNICKSYTCSGSGNCCRVNDTSCGCTVSSTTTPSDKDSCLGGSSTPEDDEDRIIEDLAHSLFE